MKPRALVTFGLEVAGLVAAVAAAGYVLFLWLGLLLTGLALITLAWMLGDGPAPERT